MNLLVALTSDYLVKAFFIVKEMPPPLPHLLLPLLLLGLLCTIGIFGQLLAICITGLYSVISRTESTDKA
jgi:hypothetical protein